MNTWTVVSTAFIASVAAAFAGGCGKMRVTDPPRTGTEQLLIATAVEDAVAQLDFGFLEDRTVFIDDSMVDRLDKTFVVAEVRAAARQAGVILADQPEQAHYIMELRAGAVGVDRREYLFGIPEADVPTLIGSLGTPEVAFYRSISQTGACQIGFVAYAREDGRFLYSAGPVYGFSDHRGEWVFGAGPGIQTDIRPPRLPDTPVEALAEEPAEGESE